MFVPSGDRHAPFVLTLTRRLAPVLLAGILTVPFTGSVAAITRAPAEPITDAILMQSGIDLVTLTNRQRAALGLVALRTDPDLMSIARDRARVMATNDVMSHTEPNGDKVFDRLDAASLTWYGAGEIIAWNTYPTEPLSVAESIRAWMASPGHHAIMVSTGYNYVGFGAAVSATGRRYYAGLFVREPDQTAPWARFATTTTRSLDAGKILVTVHYSGGDTRLQILTSGLRYFELSSRKVGGAWVSWGTTTLAARSTVWDDGSDHEVRIRARDWAGNWGAWRTISVGL
jgi:uncharacterized protein YkwD